MTAAPVTHASWKVWTNPIFRRYCRSRLRPRGVGMALLISVLLSAFIVAMARSASMRSGFDAVDAARVAIPFLLGLQCFILFVFGTAQTAGGMTAERDEGVIDYQRLIPMTPLAKVTGYLFGLPVREWISFLATLPFSAWVLWHGQIAPSVWLPLYGIVITSALSYHLTGLVTGTVVKNRRWAFLLSIGIVFALYTVIPQMAKFGLVTFKYFTIWPVVDESMPHLLPKTAGAALEALQNLAPTAKFFGLDLPESAFTAFSQGGLILTFLVMLCRKWRRAESHLLGKTWATGFYLWIQVQLLGNSLPLVDSGEIFPSRGFRRMIRFQAGWEPKPDEAVAMCGVYGFVSLVLLFLFASMVSPLAETQVRGWRRARKQGARSLPFFSDAATGFWSVAIMALGGALGWYFFSRGLVESRWFPGQVLSPGVLGVFAVVMLAAGIGYQALLEGRGPRTLVLTVIFAGVVPFMAGMVIAPISDRLAPLAVWLMGMSPASLPIFAAGSLMPIAELPPEIARAVPRAFQFWLLVTAVVALMQVRALRAERRRRAEGAVSEPQPVTPP
jgi:hypothetical protein